MAIKFRYTAKDKDGRPAAGTVEAEDQEKALKEIQALREQGFTDISIESARVVEPESAPPVEATCAEPLSASSTHKKCPFCAEEIQKDAVVCRFCRMDLRTGQPLPAGKPAALSSPEKETPATGGISSGVKIGMEVFIVLPFVLILVIAGALLLSGGLTPFLKGVSSVLLAIITSLADDWFFSVPMVVLTAIFLSRYVRNKRKYYFVISLAFLTMLGIFVYIWLG